ncbi:MAG: hypothetical protein Q9227_008778 [Pyrenula ochraceoflavens]
MPAWEKHISDDAVNKSRWEHSSCGSRRDRWGQKQVDPTEKDYDNAFEEFKKRIHANPFDALFGRRLNGLHRAQGWGVLGNWPLSDNSASQDPENKRSDQKRDNRSEDAVPTPTKDGDNLASKRNEILDIAVEYEYDPISMRKVPKLRTSLARKGDNNLKRSDTGKPVEIPVKTYRNVANADSKNDSEERKSEKVIPGQLDVSNNPISQTGSEKKASDPRAESRKSLLKDTQTVEREVEQEPPLFSGTTYERRKTHIPKSISSEPSLNWSVKEGFAGSNHSSQPTMPRPQTAPLASRLGFQMEKLEPSLDRIPHKASHQASETPFQAKQHQLETHKASKEGSRDQGNEIELLGKALQRSTFSIQRLSDKIKALQRSMVATQTLQELLETNSVSTSALRASSKHQTQDGDDGESLRTPGVRNLKARSDVQESNSDSFSDARSAQIIQDVNAREKLYAEASEEQARNQERTDALRNAEKINKENELKMENAGRALYRGLKDLYEGQYGTVDINHRQNASQMPDSLKSLLSSHKPDASKSKVDTERKVTEQPHSPEVIPGDWWQQRKARASADKESLSKTINPSNPEIQDSEPPLPASKNQYLRTMTQVGERPSRSEATESHFRPQASSMHLPRRQILYKVLAYDKSTQRVTVAETTSSFVHIHEQPLHPTEILSRLKKAAKFLPYLEDLQAQGYEIVSGSGDLLIFKKTRRFAEAPRGKLQGSGSSKGQKVRRQEPVFSGSQTHKRLEDNDDSQERNANGSTPSQQGRSRHTFKHVILTSTVTAGLCYLIGAATEGMENMDGEAYRTKGRPGIYSTQDSR